MEPDASRARSRLADLVLTAIFVAVISLPLAALALGITPTGPLTEKRPPIAQPPLTWTPRGLQTFHRNFEGYWNDNFRLRPALVRAYNAVQVWLGVAPSSQVAVGKAGWLFVGDAYQAIEYYRATRPFSPAQLAEWRRTLEARHAWLAERGIGYVFAVAPDKSTIYPEHMPAALDRVGAATRLDQLVAELAAAAGVGILDLRTALSRAKAREPVFEPLDSHWNDVGAWVVYAEIVGRLGRWFPEMQPIRLERFERHRLRGQGNDLAVLLSLGGWLTGDRLTLVPTEPRRARWLPATARDAAGTPSVVASEIDEPTLPRAVMFHDSFGESLRPLLSEHFARIVYVWDARFDPALVAREAPDVVIHEIVERSLMTDVPADAPAVARDDTTTPDVAGERP